MTSLYALIHLGKGRRGKREKGGTVHIYNIIKNSNKHSSVLKSPTMEDFVMTFTTVTFFVE